MNIGDCIKHKDDNTGQGPNGSWVIEGFEEDSTFGTLVNFRNDTYCELEWVQYEIEIGNAVYIPIGNGIIHHSVEPHKFQ